MESSGRWQLRWRLGWSFACLRHHRLLADLCPACLRRQRCLPLPGIVIPVLGRCASPQPGSVGRAPTCCGADLTRAETVRFEASHPVLAAQRRVDDIIKTGTAAFGVYAAAPVSAETALTDLKIIADRVLLHATTAALAQVIPPDLLLAHSEIIDRADTHRPGKALPPACATATAITAGLAALGASDAHHGGEALRWLVTDVRDHRAKANASTKTNASTPRRTDASPMLDAVQLVALAPSMRPADHLRYRIADPAPRRPDFPPVRAGVLARSVPTMVWTAWSLRLALPRPQQRQLRPALAAALLITGTTISTGEAAGLLGCHATSYQIARALGLLADCGRWEPVRQALTRMADYLADTGTPIDYQRRRRLDYTDLLPDPLWHQLCCHAGLPSLSARATARRARCFLFERLSGLPFDAHPAAVETNHFRYRTTDFARVLTPQLVHSLDDYALEFLAAHHIHDEPPTWQPPTGLLDGLDLPGSDPTDVDIDRVHRLIRHEDRTVSDTAAALAVTSDTIRHVLEVHPAPISVHAAARTTQYRTATRTLPRDTFIDLYLHQHLSIRRIADRVGVGTETVTRLARHYDIPLRQPGRQLANTIDGDWLHEQYVILGRSMTAVARDAGVTWTTMARWAERHHIPLRRSEYFHRRRNHPTPAQIAALPPVLQPALATIGGLDRLHDFATTSHHSTFAAAAETIGIHPTTLIDLINQLEKDLGGTLLHRATRRTPMTPTPLGQAVLDALNESSQPTETFQQSSAAESTLQSRSPSALDD